MFDRKEAIVKNKKFFISHEYIRKLFESNRSQRNIKSKDNNSDFKKVETIQKINVANDQPLVLFHKPNQYTANNFENKIKKDLIENKGYLNDGGYKQKLLKYYSCHLTDQNNHSKNLFRSSFSQHKSTSKNIQNQNSKRISFSMALNKRTLQKEYSNTIKKVNNRPKIRNKREEQKEKQNKLFNSVNVKDVKYKRNFLIKKLTDNNYLVKNLFKKANIKEKENNLKEKVYKRKKEYLDQNYNMMVKGKIVI